jgi:pimeloyl-ACP methyl ester carboxylesterase
MPHLAVADDTEIFYSDDGSGPAVLMLHGIAGDGGDWSWLATDLAADHRVVVVDHRGHGRSTANAGPYDARTLAGDAAKVLRHLSIENAVVVGHSLGGLVASALAVEWPDIVTALVLVDPAYGFTDEALVPMGVVIAQHGAEGLLGLIAQRDVETGPRWQRFWRGRRILGTPATVIAKVFADSYRAMASGSGGSVKATSVGGNARSSPCSREPTPSCRHGRGHCRTARTTRSCISSRPDTFFIRKSPRNSPGSPGPGWPGFRSECRKAVS